jgi:hypothetical protein
VAIEKRYQKKMAVQVNEPPYAPMDDDPGLKAGSH